MVRLADGRMLSAGIIVQAEGGVFSEQTAKSVQRDYDQVAIVAHVKASAAIPHRAFERFTSEGPLALLPCDDGYSLVWCVRPATAQQLLALDDTGFLQALQTAFGTRLGRIHHIDTAQQLSARPQCRTGIIATHRGNRQCGAKRCTRLPVKDSTWACATPPYWRRC